jgi:hypothetical protein
MSRIDLQLSVAGRYFSLSPVAPHLHASCTADGPCTAPASHRLLSRRTASVSLFCDAHTEEWAREQGVLPDAAPATRHVA